MALPENPIMFANNPLDRAGHQRGNADWLAAQLASDAALIVPLWNLQPLVLPELQAGDGRDVGYLPKAAFAEAWRDDMAVVFLGLNRRGKPLFAADISHMSAPDLHPDTNPALIEDAYAFQRLLGFHLQRWEDGLAELHQPVVPHIGNRYGLPHGGVHAALPTAAWRQRQPQTSSKTIARGSLGVFTAKGKAV